MKAAAFEYMRAESVDDACAMLARHGVDARLIAGGQSLVPMMAMRLVRPSVIVDIHRIPAVQEWRGESGALATPLLLTPLTSSAMRWLASLTIGSPSLRRVRPSTCARSSYGPDDGDRLHLHAGPPSDRDGAQRHRRPHRSWPLQDGYR